MIEDRGVKTANCFAVQVEEGEGGKMGTPGMGKGMDTGMLMERWGLCYVDAVSPSWHLSKRCRDVEHDVHAYGHDRDRDHGDDDGLVYDAGGGQMNEA
jgi:hypothetical protein